MSLPTTSLSTASTVRDTRIYLADLRGRTESRDYRSLHSFNIGEYQNESRKPFFNLNALNDETLAPGKKVEFKMEQNSSVGILPLVGGVAHAIDQMFGEFTQPGEWVILSISAGETLTLKNPYEDEHINYLTIWFSENEMTEPIKSSFDLDAVKNSMIPLSTKNPRISIGKFSGRIDSRIAISPNAKGAFAFVIEGAFEFENCLIQPRDGLTIEGKLNLEFESLSSEGIILLAEVY